MKIFAIVWLLVKVWERHQVLKMFPHELNRIIEARPELRVNIRAIKN